MTRLGLAAVICACACSGVSHSSRTGDEEQGVSSAAVEQPAAGDAVPERELARAARAALEREDPEAGPPEAAELAKRHRGWVEAMSARSITVQVPGNEVDALLTELPKLGKVTERHFEAHDVSAAHRDLLVRIDSLKRERDRYLALLERAGNIAEATSVEHEVERITRQLELLEAQLLTASGRVQDATVRLDFSRELRPGPVGYVFYAVFSGVKWLFVRD